MSVIQKIRDKYARISVIAIALALLGFILMDAFTGKSNLFRGNSTTLGKVNGTTIDYQDFNKKLAAAEEYRKSQGYPVNGDGARQQLVDQLWQSEVDQTLLSTEFNKLGIDVGVKELNDILFGDNPPQDLRQRFSDPKTGVYDAAQAQQFINQLKKSKNDAEKQQFSQYLQNLEDSRKAEKYTSLLTNSINYPKWFIEQQNAENSEIAKASFVRVPYTSIADSTIKISDDQIQDYINKHKDDYKQQESRSISYVLFNASPNAGDTAAAKKDIESLKDEFAKTDDPAAFLARNGSTLKYADIYIGKSELENANKQMNATNKDTILSLPKGTVYGPYLDGGNFVLAKMIDSKELPDSVKCRHILIGTTDRQGQQLMDDSVAHRLADSIATAIKNGANFDTLETKFSTDEAAHKDKGVMTFPSSQIQSEGFAPEFGKFILFDGKPGDKKVVKTQFGWHYIEILDFIKPEPHYKVAYLGKQINASNETDNAANNMASQFSGDSRSVKSFDANAEKLKAKGYNKLIATEIKPNDYSVTGVGVSRQFVKAIYKADLGDVLEAYRVGDNYVVAAVTEVFNEGTASVSRVRSSIEPVLRNKAKAEQIKKKIGTVSSLEAVATANGQQVETADSLRFNGQSPNLGFEYRVIGAVFNPANKGKLVNEPIEGQQGVYVLRVDSVGTTAVENANVDEQRRMLIMQAKQALMGNQFGGGFNPADVLKKSATIKDYRSKFY